MLQATSPSEPKLIVLTFLYPYVAQAQMGNQLRNLSRCGLEGKWENSFIHPWVQETKIANGLRALARPMSPWIMHCANQAYVKKLLQFLKHL